LDVHNEHNEQNLLFDILTSGTEHSEHNNSMNPEQTTRNSSPDLGASPDGNFLSALGNRRGLLRRGRLRPVMLAILALLL
jgi:hypothetical protein